MNQKYSDTDEMEAYCETCGFEKTHSKIGAGEYQCRGCGGWWYR